MTISAVSAETGRAVEELDVEYAGEPLEIGFNARYILDMLQQIDGDDGAVRDGQRRGTDRGARPGRREHALRADAHARMTALPLAREAGAAGGTGSRAVGQAARACTTFATTASSCWLQAPAGRSCCTATTVPARPTCSRPCRCWPRAAGLRRARLGELDRAAAAPGVCGRGRWPARPGRDRNRRAIRATEPADGRRRRASRCAARMAGRAS